MTKHLLTREDISEEIFSYLCIITSILNILQQSLNCSSEIIRLHVFIDYFVWCVVVIESFIVILVGTGLFRLKQAVNIQAMLWYVLGDSVLKVKNVVCASLFMIAAHVKQLPLFFCQTLSEIIKVSLLIDWSITLLMIDLRSRGSNRHIRDFLLTYLTK